MTGRFLALLIASFLALMSSVLLCSWPSAHAGPWEDLMGQGEPNVFTDPMGRFALDLPDGWKAEVRSGPRNVVDFWKTDADLGYVARVSVEVRGLPKSVRLTHFDARIEDEAKQSRPGYRVVKVERAQVSGVPARKRFFTYRERNNAQLMNEVLQVVLIVGERGFIITFETAYGASGRFSEDFQRIQSSFTGRAPGDESMLMKDQPRVRKVRRGEMVNPDAIKY